MEGETTLIKGMDLSFIPQYEDEKRRFYNAAGEETDPILLAKENGVNLVRLRIWNEPKNVEPMGYCDLEHTIAMAKRIKEAKMEFMLDFHYSDTWADPGNQRKPKAWEELTVIELGQAVYDYTLEVLTALSRENVLPEYVQIGNEIRSGMLFPEGTTEHWENLALFINEGIRAVRDFDPEHKIQIMIHLDQGGRFYYLRDWFDAALNHGVKDFDIIGISYYPFWHGGYHEFKNSMEQLVERYQKPILVAETAYAYRITPKSFIGEQQEKISGFPITPKGQLDCLNLIMNITANVSNHMGIGVCYWEPFSFPDENGGWGENMGLIDEKGHLLEGIQSYQYQVGDYKNDAVARVYEPELLQCLLSERDELQLPTSISVLTFEGKQKKIPLQFSESLEVPEEPCIQEISGVAINACEDGYIEKLPVIQKIQWLKQRDMTANLIVNGDFGQEFEGWNVTKSDDLVFVEIREELVNPFPEPPVPNAYVQSGINFTLDLNQQVNVKEQGTYRLSLKLRGDNTTGVDVELYTMNYDGRQSEKTLTIYPQNEQWMEYEIPDIEVTSESVTVGLRICAPPIHLNIKEFCFKKQINLSKENSK